VDAVLVRPLAGAPPAAGPGRLCGAPGLVLALAPVPLPVAATGLRRPAKRPVVMAMDPTPVPDEARPVFRARLLDKGIAYDREHQAGLVRTLEAFLRSDGSWTR
ncbi:hypothetical protein VM98_38525, partial [Streptomyces rubellomurinus subsp. indigoferus]